jgi:uncharacterized coiled-coil DUF342 family protein
MRKSQSNRPSRETDAIEAIDELQRSLRDLQPRIAKLRVTFAEKRRQEQRDRVSAKGKEKPAVPRARKSNRNARPSRRP